MRVGVECVISCVQLCAREGIALPSLPRGSSVRACIGLSEERHDPLSGGHLLPARCAVSGFAVRWGWGLHGVHGVQLLSFRLLPRYEEVAGIGRGLPFFLFG
jgi:hypothetical protein